MINNMITLSVVPKMRNIANGEKKNRVIGNGKFGPIEPNRR